jgi:transposase
MANKPLIMQQIRMLIQLLERGYSQRHISRALQRSRNTVSYYCNRLSSYNLSELQTLDDGALSQIVYGKAGEQTPADSDKLNTFPPLLREDDFNNQLSYFCSELKRTGVTRLLLWREYKGQYPTGYGYTQFCERLKAGQKISEATMHFSYHPAEVMMVDFAGDKMHYVEKETGLMVECPVFVCVLPYSGYAFALALPNMKSEQVIMALNACLHYFGGVTQSVKCDNMAQAVRKSCRYEPLFTDIINDWTLHNHTTPMAARPRKPKDKASVENLVNLTYQRIYAPLRNTTFFSLTEINNAIDKQLKLHNEQLFQKKDFSRMERFIKEEQPLLQPLPATPYFIRHTAQAKVQRNYHIVLGEDWHYYSVPFSFIGKTVNAVYDSDTVEIYFEHNRIAFHRRSYKKHGYTTLKEHMPESHRRYSEQRGWTDDYFLEQAAKTGAHVHLYIEALLKGKEFKEQAYNSCLGLLRLTKAYGNERMDAACKRALKGQVYNYRTIDNILKNGLDKQELLQQGDLFQIPLHDNVRGAKAYE